jgi:RimJ/RimL family protein N-acetyltransferase
MLKSDRVTLRPHRREDVPKTWEFRTNVTVELATGGDPPKPIMLEQVESEFEKREFIFEEGFAIDAEDRYIGFCGLFNYNHTAQSCELGISIGETEYWGKGFGREAMRLLLDYGFRMRNVQRIWLNTQANNERAIRCYLACGFVEEGRLRRHAWSNGDYHDVVYMGILREEWERANS